LRTQGVHKMPEGEGADRGILNRVVLQSEGYGMSHDLPAGIIVYRWTSQKYGEEKPSQILVTAEPREPPFFSIPREAVDWDDPQINLL
jgi:hypothetical protein